MLHNLLNKDLTMPVANKNKPVVKAAISKHNGRVIIYPEPKALIAIGAKATTIDQAKNYLGWTTNPEDAKKAGLNVDEPLLQDLDGNKVWCLNNIINRPLYEAIYRRLMQEHLNFRWKFNAEPIIIGETGLILNGQHCLISLVLAWQELMGKNKLSWDARGWVGKELTMDKMITFGIEESDDVINTMDTAKPRTLAEVIYRSPYFRDMGVGKRKQAAKMADHAIRMAWSRTGMGLDAFSPQRTHAESLAFANNHPRLFECVRKILDLDGKKGISNRLPLGYASAIMWLMAGSATEETEYYGTSAANERSEAHIDFSNFDKAYELWTLLAKGDSRVAGVGQAFARAQEDGEHGSLAEKLGILANAWHEFLDGYDEGREVKEGAIRLNPKDYVTDGEGQVHLIASGLLFGGVDHGDAKFEKKAKKWEAKVLAPPKAATSGAKPTGTKPVDNSELYDLTDEEGETVVAGDDVEDDEPSEEELAELEARKAEVMATKNGKKPSSGAVPFTTIFKAAKEEHPDKVLLFKTGENYDVWGGDATVVGDLCSVDIIKHANGLYKTTIPAKRLDETVKAINGRGRSVATLLPETAEVVNVYEYKPAKAKEGGKKTATEKKPSKPGKK